MTPAERFVEHDGVYLLSHSIGLPVRGAPESVDDFFDAWTVHTTDAWPRWLESLFEFRRSLGRLLGAEPSTICPQSNVSSALTKILGSLRLPHRPTILMTEDAFPSLGYVGRSAGFDVRYIDRGHDATDPEVWRDHLGADTDVVLVTHVHSNTGELLPVSAVVDLARDRGTYTVVDVAQSAGAVPIDVTEWKADFVVGSCVKWLSGGPGAGWLRADPDVVDRCTPRDVGWFSHEDPFEMDIHRFRYADDALRFWGGTPTVLPFVIARHAIDTIHDIGVPTIRDHNRALTDRLIDALGERVVSPHRNERRGGTCIVDAGADTAAELVSGGFAVDHRARGVRISPHVHCDRDDIDALIELLRV